MLFVGIDLAWSPKNGTGIAVIEGDGEKATFCKSEIIQTDEEIISFVTKEVGSKSAYIAIDAPLIVPNEEGRRVAEAVVGNLFRKYDAGAHPSNRKRLSQWSGTIRGEELAKKLEALNFLHNPYLEQGEQKRKFFEVYPHPSMVVLFNLKKILQYKAKPKRDHQFLCSMFKQYQFHLKNLKKVKPMLHLPKNILEKKLDAVKGKKLKQYEDMLDSIFCAYIAYYAWMHPEKCAVLGTLKEGYILTPVFDHMQEALKIKQQSLTSYATDH